MFGTVVLQLFIQHGVNTGAVSRGLPLILDDSADHDSCPVPVFIAVLQE